MNWRNTCILLLLFISVLNVAAIAQRKTPSERHTTITLPPISKDSIELLIQSNPNLFAYPYIIDKQIIINSNAEAITIGDTIVYAYTFISAGANTLNAIFDSVHIPPSAYIYISNPTETQKYGPYRQSEVIDSYLPTPLIFGDTLCITYKAHIRDSAIGSLRIHQIAHDFTQEFAKTNDLKSLSGSCNINVNCPEGSEWDNEKRAVCRIITSGTTACTGTLINNTSNDFTPYIITANHCVNTEQQAKKSVFYFNYEQSNCNGTAINNYQIIEGASLIATPKKGNIDFALLLLSKNIPEEYNVYYAGWSAEESNNKGSICIHHPKADFKKISIDEDYYESSSFLYFTKNSHWHIKNWEKGTTEGGSSGSALFSMNKHIVGILSGGKSSCESPSNDYFTKFSYAWDYYPTQEEQLKYWLDPENTKQKLWYGISNKSYAPIRSNITKQDSICIYDFNQQAEGTWTSANELAWDAWADKFIFNSYSHIYAYNIAGIIDTLLPLHDIKFSIWQGSDSPTRKLYERSLADATITNNVALVTINPALPVPETFWVGYEVAHNSKAFTAYLAKNRTTTNTLFIRSDSLWLQAQNTGMRSSLAVEIYTTNMPDTIVYTQTIPTHIDKNKSESIMHFASPEIFGIDSFPVIKKNTTHFTIASPPYIDSYNAPNNLNSRCVGNTFSSASIDYIRGTKIALTQVPLIQQNYTIQVSTDNFGHILYEKHIENNLLQSNAYNEISFDSIIQVPQNFSIAFCFDTNNNYTKNPSVLSYFQPSKNVLSSIYIPEVWTEIRNFNIIQNYAIQAMKVYGLHHYNRNKNVIIYSPVVLADELELFPKVDVILYPNPTDNFINIQFQELIIPQIDISIYTSNGKKLIEKTIEQHNGYFTVDIQTLPTGIYIIEIKTNHSVFSKKVIVQRKITY